MYEGSVKAIEFYRKRVASLSSKPFEIRWGVAVPSRLKAKSVVGKDGELYVKITGDTKAFLTDADFIEWLRSNIVSVREIEDKARVAK